MNWLLRDGRLVGRDGVCDVAIREGRIVSIDDQLSFEGDGRELDLEGRLVVPGFVDAHMHLDKAYALDDAAFCSACSLDEAVEAFMEWREGITPEHVYRNARRVARAALGHGTVALRTHVTVDSQVGLSWLEPLVRLRDELQSELTIQIVALPDTEEVVDGTARPLLRDAMDAGADLIGGAPHMVPRYRHVINELVDLAGTCGCDLDLHVDESDDPSSNSLEYLADRKMTTGFVGTVTAAHCCALSALDDRSAERVIEKVAAASINIVTLPSCNLYLGGRDDRGLIRRGLTRVRELQVAGVNVAFASDNIRDAFNPFGTGDMLQQLLIAAHALHLGTSAELETGLDMGTRNAAQILGLKDYGLQLGNVASLVVLDDSDLGSAVARIAPRRYVFSHGELVAQTKVEQDFVYD